MGCILPVLALRGSEIMNRSFCFAFLRSRLLAWSSWNTEEFNFWTLQYYWGETSEILLFVLVTIRSERRVFLGSSHTSHKVELKKEDWPFFFICIESKDNLISSLHFGKPEKGESWVFSNQTNVVLEVNHPASEQSWWPVLFPWRIWLKCTLLCLSDWSDSIRGDSTLYLGQKSELLRCVFIHKRSNRGC